MTALSPLSFSGAERKATSSIALLVILRMLGLFMVLPVFSHYALQLVNATPTLVGFALGVYGLTQALLQIPFGMLSDYFNRKWIIALGLILFIAGSVWAASASTIQQMIAARALQGLGAVGSATTALLADFTREALRSKAMFFMGISIGLSFILAILLGPLLQHWCSVPQIFVIAAGLGSLSLLILWSWVPHAPEVQKVKDKWRIALSTVIKQVNLIKLNMGILILHAVLSALFIILPLILLQLGLSEKMQWQVYLPALLAGCVIMFPLMRLAEKPGLLQPIFGASILTLLISLALLAILQKSMLLLVSALSIFFAAFNLLEALLPALVSRVAPASYRGTALGVNSTAQFLGIFIGGWMGGWLYGQAGIKGVFLCTDILVILWWLVARTMTLPQSHR